MARKKRRRSADDDDVRYSFEAQLTFHGALANEGEIPGAELGAALIGWDRLLQLSYYAHQRSVLEVSKPGTAFRTEFRIRRVSEGSVTVGVVIVLAGFAMQGIIGNRADVMAMKFLGWTIKLVRKHIAAKSAKRKTLDDVVDAVEELANDEEIRISRNREDSEDFVIALNGALESTTVPLDSSAAREILSFPGQQIEFELDSSGRAAIRAPFDPPALDLEAEPLIEAPVKFIRINKKTGKGILQFVRPQDESQLGQQRFHAEDKAIRRRANQYTGAFHEDTPLSVRMQRKAYSSERHGHYWLIIGTVSPEPESGLYAGLDGEPRAPTRGRRKGQEGKPSIPYLRS